MPLEHVILDLDNTLICSTYVTDELSEEKKKDIKDLKKIVMEDYYDIYERPGLQEFLDYLFSTYKVSVFTAASKDYALFIIDKFILTKPERELDYIFWSYHCMISKGKYKGNNKRIAMLIEDFDLGDSYKLESTVLIDDLSDWGKDQRENVITIKGFEVEEAGAQNDNELIEIRRQLEERRLSLI
jgi:TFIIF-interacting CTD phosphatase-like protein